MPYFTDQMQRTIYLAREPQRLVSVVPSQTELLFDLGVGAKVIGRTKFCIHPASAVATVPRVGGTKQLHRERIAALAPDLILGNKEENTQADMEWLAARFPVWLSDIPDLPAALTMIRAVGQLTGADATAAALANALANGFAQLPEPRLRPRVAYCIWWNPLMVAASGTFIHDLLQRAGFTNVFADEERYPVVTLAELVKRAPDRIFLSSEPFPFAAAHQASLQGSCPGSRIELVDGELFSWYGSRLQQSLHYLPSLHLAL